MAAVNAAIDVAASWPGVRVLDLALVPALSQPGGWSADRVHPSAAGHHGIAAAAIRSLLAGGRHHPTLMAEPVLPRGPARVAQGWWTVRHGLPYAASHLRELGGPVAACVLHRD